MEQRKQKIDQILKLSKEELNELLLDCPHEALSGLLKSTRQIALKLAKQILNETFPIEELSIIIHL